MLSVIDDEALRETITKLPSADLSEAVCRPIEGFPGYWIDVFGRVFSINKNKTLNQIKAYCNPRNGYYCVKLMNEEGKHKHMSIHRLVALTFVPNPNPDLFDTVNHIDENKTNNIVTNLEWTTREANLAYGGAEERRRESLKQSAALRKEKKEKTRIRAQAQPSSRSIISISKSGSELSWDSVAEAARNLGIDRRNIQKVLNGERESAGGHRFKYKEDSDDV